MHLNALANGLGSQSILLMLMAMRRQIPATVSFTGDTGWEFDRLWSNGRRASVETYFDEVVKPLAAKYDFDVRFVRSVDKNKKPLPGLLEYTREIAKSGDFRKLNIPMFGGDGGRIMQRCTDKMKLRACRQEARSMGATSCCFAIGIHVQEAKRRMSGIYLRKEGAFTIYQTVLKTKDGDKPIKWLTHSYPFVDLGKTRQDCQRGILAEGIPYLISTECDGCPHQDLARWERTDPGVLRDLADLESQFKGEVFFTEERIPLLESLELKKKKRFENPDLFQRETDFGCQNAICGL